MAEFIPARWAYEALMVDQFKNNLFEKNFFDLETKESKYNYKRGPYLSFLINTLDEIPKLLKDSSVGKEHVVNKLALLQNEIRKEMILNPQLLLNCVGRLEKGKITTFVIDSTREYLDNLNTIYSLNHLGILARKEILLYNMQSNPKKKVAFRQLKDDYYNEYLADIVKKTYSAKKLFTDKGTLKQITDPIFNGPSEESGTNFRAHFYSPSKFLLTKYIDTFTFNLIVLWFFIIISYGCLYGNVLKKIIGLRLWKKF